MARVALFPSISTTIWSDADSKTARMGRTREKKANRINVSLNIVKRSLCRAKIVPGG